MTATILNTPLGRVVVAGLQYHRNGVSGAGYYAARLQIRADGRRYSALAIVFDAMEHVAVTADEGAISFRCEDLEDRLREFIDSPAGQHIAFGDFDRQIDAEA